MGEESDLERRLDGGQPEVSEPATEDGSGERPEIRPKFIAARAGSREALGELFSNCRNYLLLVANTTVGNDLQAKIAASDLVQETFLEAQLIFDRFKGDSEEELLRWLTRILENKLGNALKSFTWTAKRDLSREVRPASGDSVRLFESLPAKDGETPSGCAVAAENSARLRAAMEELSEEHRQVIELRIQHRLPFDEIGRRMSRSSEAARKLFARAIDRLGEQMGE